MESIVTAIAALISAAAAIIAFVQVGKAHASNEAQVLHAFSKRYQEDRMLVAVRRLSEVRTASSSVYTSLVPMIAVLEASRLADAKLYREIRGHARCVNAYFSDIAISYECKLISLQLAMHLIKTPVLNVFYEIGEPIAAWRNEQTTTTSHKKTLQKLLRKYGEGWYPYPAANVVPFPGASGVSSGNIAA